MTAASDLASQGYVKVRMWDADGFTETAWAVRVEPGLNHFRLDNSPFYAYGVSADDIVEAEPVADGLYEFLRVVTRSGNRTIRLMFGEQKADTDYGKGILDGIVALGCTFEGMFNTVISVTIPPGVELTVVTRFLTETGLRWEYADPTYADLFGSDGPA